MSDPANTLIMKTVRLNPGDRVLLLNADPVVARWAAEQTEHGIAFHSSYRALKRLQAVSGLQTSEDVYPAPDESADVALLELPKGRDFTRAYLWTAAQALRPGGRLYLAGDNAAGAKSAIADAGALFGRASVLGYKGGGRIALGIRPDQLEIPAGWLHSWEPERRTIHDFVIMTMPGVFSWDHLDDGTALLLDHFPEVANLRVLDIGCGYGIIGLTAARAGASAVVMVDDDLLAVRCARASMEANDLADRCVVLPSDVTEAVQGQIFDWVFSNPPFHQGIEVTTATAERIVRESYAVLGRGGRLRIVANRFLPYQQTMVDVFGNATIITQTGRFAVWEAVKTEGSHS